MGLHQHVPVPHYLDGESTGGELLVPDAVRWVLEVAQLNLCDGAIYSSFLYPDAKPREEKCGCPFKGNPLLVGGPFAGADISGVAEFPIRRVSGSLAGFGGGGWSGGTLVGLVFFRAETKPWNSSAGTGTSWLPPGAPRQEYEASPLGWLSEASPLGGKL